MGTKLNPENPYLLVLVIVIFITIYVLLITNIYYNIEASKYFWAGRRCNVNLQCSSEDYVTVSSDITGIIPFNSTPGSSGEILTVPYPSSFTSSGVSQYEISINYTSGGISSYGTSILPGSGWTRNETGVSVFLGTSITASSSTELTSDQKSNIGTLFGFAAGTSPNSNNKINFIFEPSTKNTSLNYLAFSQNSFVERITSNSESTSLFQIPSTGILINNTTIQTEVNPVNVMANHIESEIKYQEGCRKFTSLGSSGACASKVNSQCGCFDPGALNVVPPCSEYYYDPQTNKYLLNDTQSHNQNQSQTLPKEVLYCRPSKNNTAAFSRANNNKPNQFEPLFRQATSSTQEKIQDPNTYGVCQGLSSFTAPADAANSTDYSTFIYDPSKVFCGLPFETQTDGDLSAPNSLFDYKFDNISDLGPSLLNTTGINYTRSSDNKRANLGF